MAACISVVKHAINGLMQTGKIKHVVLQWQESNYRGVGKNTGRIVKEHA